MDAAKFAQHMAERAKSVKRFEKIAKWKPGPNKIRLLPGWRKGEEYIWDREFAQHFVKDAAGKIQAVQVCNLVTFGTPCAVCAAMGEANKHVHDDVTQELVDQAYAGRTFLANGLMLDSSEPHTPVILEFKGKLYQQMLDMLKLYGPEVFFSLDKGHDITVTRSGTTKNDTSYTAMPSLQPGAAIPTAVLSKLHNLDEYVQQGTLEKEKRAIAAINMVVGLIPASAPQTPAGPALAAPSAPIGVPVGLSAAAPAASSLIPELGEDLDALLADPALAAAGA